MTTITIFKEHCINPQVTWTVVTEVQSESFRLVTKCRH